MQRFNSRRCLGSILYMESQREGSHHGFFLSQVYFLEHVSYNVTQLLQLTGQNNYYTYRKQMAHSFNIKMSIKISKKKMKNSIEKQAKDLYRYFTKRKIKTGNRHIKIYVNFTHSLKFQMMMRAFFTSNGQRLKRVVMPV